MLQGLRILAALTEGSIHSLLFTSGSTLPLITTALGGWCSLFSTGTHRLTVHRYIEIKTHQRGGRGVFFPPSERTTKWTFLQLRSFNAVSHVVVTPNHKVIQLLHHNCNLINVMNHNAKLVRRTADMHPPWKDHWTPKQVITHRLRATVLDTVPFLTFISLWKKLIYMPYLGTQYTFILINYYTIKQIYESRYF